MQKVRFAVDGDFKLAIENEAVFEAGVRDRLRAVGAATRILIQRQR